MHVIYKRSCARVRALHARTLVKRIVHIRGQFFLNKYACMQRMHALKKRVNHILKTHSPKFETHTIYMCIYIYSYCSEAR